jgi:hypothetical protein
VLEKVATFNELIDQLCMQLVAKFIIHLHWTIIIYRVVPHEPTRRGPRFRGGLQRAGGVQAGGAGAAGMKGGGAGHTTGAADTCSAIGVYDRRGERAQRVVSSAESGLGLRDYFVLFVLP